MSHPQDIRFLQHRFPGLLLLLLLPSLLNGCSLFGFQKRWKADPEYLELAAQVEIRRTHYGA